MQVLDQVFILLHLLIDFMLLVSNLLQLFLKGDLLIADFLNTDLKPLNTLTLVLDLLLELLIRIHHALEFLKDIRAVTRHLGFGLVELLLGAML